MQPTLRTEFRTKLVTSSAVSSIVTSIRASARSLAAAGVALGAVFGLPSLTAASAPAAQKATAEQKSIQDRELNGAAKLFASYEEAKRINKGSYEVQADLEKEFGKVGKKLGGDGKSPDALLAHPWSLARAVWLSADYEGKASKQRKEFGKVTERTTEGGTKLALWVPGKYRPKDGPYPLLLCIADEGVKPEQHIMEDWVDGSIRDSFLIATPEMPGNASLWLDTDGIKSVMFALRDVRNNYAIDFDQIFIGGRGRGVETAHAIAARFPDQFAGVFGWAGDANGDVQPENFRNIPCYFAGGGTKATAFKKACEDLKLGSVTLKQDGKSVDIADWAKTVRRSPYPDEVSLVQKNGSPTNCYWITVARVDAERVAIDAKVDRATNTITIEAEGLDAATIYLNDALVDLDKTVTIIANGAETKFTESRNMSFALELFMLGRNDGGRFFVAQRAVSIPARETSADEKKDDGKGSLDAGR
ncbi:MAG: hypothetical protein R3F49_20345 [Planctomycetota bacterium]